jgi:hypothetical protein
MLEAVASVSGIDASVGLSHGRTPNIHGLDRRNSIPLNNHDSDMGISKAAKVVRPELSPSITKPFRLE